MKLFSFLQDAEIRSQKEFLSHLSLFQGLRSNDITHLMKSLQERTYLKGETIFVEGDIGRGLFIVASGTVQLTKMNPEGKQAVLAQVHPGEFFGEMALLEEMPRSATAVAAENTKIHILYKVKLETLLYEYPRVGVVIMNHLARMLSARLRSTQERKAEQDKQ